MKLLWLAILSAAGLFAQNPAQILPTTSNPTGLHCSATSMRLRTPAGTLYTCANGLYAAVAGSGGGNCTVAGSTNVLQKNNGSGGCAASSVTDNGTTIVTTEPFQAPSVATGSAPPAVTVGTGGVPFACGEGTAPSAGVTAGVDVLYCDSTLHKPLLSNNGGSYFALTQTIASGAKALATGAIASAACTSAQTDTATGTLTTDAINASFNGDPTAVTGYVPLTAGMLTIIVYPTADTVNFKVCNNTSSSITPGAITLNWRVVR